MLRSTFLVWVFGVAGLGGVQGATLLEQRIEELRRTSRAVEAGTLGIEIVQLATGKVLYSLNGDHLLTPASNTKLFSTALALVRLGPHYRLTTRIYGGRAPAADGRLSGDLTIVGGGDPSMSYIRIPYDRDAKPADPLEGIEAFADQLAARGLRHVAGDIVGDDGAYRAEHFPPGWGVDDPLWEDGAPVSALCLGDNSIRVDIYPGAAEGDPATIRFTPAVEYFLSGNRVRTTSTGSHHLELRRFNGRELEFSGKVSSAAGRLTEWVAVDDPALYTATALYDSLVRRGISIAGHPVARHRYHRGPVRSRADGVVLAQRESPELAQLLRVTDKVSQNLWAELMLREVGRVRGADGSRKEGLRQMTAFLNEVGIEAKDYVLDDGSGLSRLTLLKPAAIVRLLRFMKRSDVSDTWLSLMPVGGEDGTLEKRFKKDPAAKSIRAKTGSLSHVNALSGYADSATYGEVAFSIIVNHTNAPSSEIREFIDKIGVILLE